MKIDTNEPNLDGHDILELGHELVTHKDHGRVIHEFKPNPDS